MKSAATEKSAHVPKDGQLRPAKPGMPIRNIILLALAVGALAVSAPNLWYRHNHETTDDAQVEGHIISVMPRVGGYVSFVRVVDEQAVKAGDTLFALDVDELRIKVRQAEADLMAAQAAANGGVAGAGAKAAESQKAATQANLQSAKANLEKARQDAERARKLFQQEIASKAQLDAAEAALLSAHGSFDAVTEQARGSNFTIAGANAQVRAADARLAASEAALDQAKLQLSYGVALAPTSGHIAKKTLEPGQLVAPGQPVMAIVEDGPVWIVANLKETQLQRLHVGQSVEIDVDAFPGLPVRGQVASVQYATGARFSLLPPDNASGNYTKVVQRVPVRIELEPGTPPDLLRPGMSVDVAIDIRPRG